MPEPNVASILRDLVRIPSLSRQESKVADYLVGFFTGSGVNVSRAGNNVVASIGSGPTSLLLNSHLDTVPPASGQPFGAFEAVIEDGWMYGRGTVDAKASVAAMSCALVELKNSGWSPARGRLVAAFTVCEETGGEDNGLESILPDLLPVESALVGEPTHMQPCIAQKGLLILRMISNGIAAHAARSGNGSNAIAKQARDLVALSNLEFERVHPLLGPTTLEPTMIQGGTARNVIPDKCETFLDIRSTPSYRHAELYEIVQNCIESDLVIHSDRMIPVDTKEDATIVSACLEAHPGAKTFGSPTMSDWLYLNGIATVKMGPGNSNLSHTAGERILIQELEAAPEIFVNTIVNYFSTI